MTVVSWEMLPLALGICASGATLLGGLLALKLARRANIVTAFSAGVVLGVALFDLVPEALDYGMRTPGRDMHGMLLFVAGGLVAYMLVDRGLTNTRAAPRRWQPHMAPALLTLHSLVDGLGIGLAFQLSSAIGWAVAIAVLTHDMVDGVNVVSICLSQTTERTTRRWLIADVVAPLLGAVIGQLVRLPSELFGPLLAFFAGAFLYIGAGELLPRSFARSPTLHTTLATIIGLAVMYAATIHAG